MVTTTTIFLSFNTKFMFIMKTHPLIMILNRNHLSLPHLPAQSPQHQSPTNNYLHFIKPLGLMITTTLLAPTITQSINNNIFIYYN